MVFWGILGRFQAFYKIVELHALSSYALGITESTAGADASVEALKLYHMKLTIAYSSLLALLAIVACMPCDRQEWEMIAVIVAKKRSKSTNGRARLLLNVEHS